MTPTWRKLFDSWEKAVAPGLEEMTASNEFRQAVATVTKLNAAVGRQVEQASRQWLHAWNLPTATDVRRLRRQISGLEDEVGSLRRALQLATKDKTNDRLVNLATLDPALDIAGPNGVAN